MKALGGAAAAVALCAACAARQPVGGTGTVAASVLRAGTQCGGDVSGPSAHWIATQGELVAAMGMGGAFGAGPEKPVDFRREGVLAVYMGQRPTAGWGLALDDSVVAIKDGVGTIAVRFHEPAPGAAVAQVLTSPCLLVRMRKDGMLRVRVVDAAGALRATAEVLALPSTGRPPGERPLAPP